MTNYDDIISFESLYGANRRCLNGKRSKTEAITYQEKLGSNLVQLHYKLKYHHYTIKTYHRFMIFDPKEREIQAIAYEDRIVQKTLCDNYLTPLLDRYLIFHNVACRQNKGTSLAMRYLKSSLRKMWLKHQDNFYIIKIDIRKFFETIDHETLKTKLKRIVKDTQILRLLKVIIDSFNHDTKKGLPMGNQTSQCFALLYLNEVDHYIKEKLHVQYYLRYMDDMIMLVKDKQTAINIFEKVKIKIRTEQLVVNPKSTIIKCSKGFEFLGRYISFSKSGKIIIRIKRSSKERILKHIQYNAKINTTKENQMMLAAYNGTFKHINNYNTFQHIKKLCNLEQQQNITSIKSKNK